MQPEQDSGIGSAGAACDRPASCGKRPVRVTRERLSNREQRKRTPGPRTGPFQGGCGVFYAPGILADGRVSSLLRERSDEVVFAEGREQEGAARRAHRGARLWQPGPCSRLESQGQRL